MTKPMMDLPMNTKSDTCGCGGPPSHVDVPCPSCGAKGMRVKAGTVRYHLNEEFRGDAEGIYGLCLSADCEVSWYAQDGSHHFTTAQTETPIWTKDGADPVYACYCNEITRDMVRYCVSRKGMRTPEEIYAHYLDGEPVCACAARNPSGQCCNETFEKMIGEELMETLRCKRG